MEIETVRVTLFALGDKIGWHGQHDNEWAGTVTISEPCAEGWHLAWVDYHQPGLVFHWRGASSKRDTRWTASDEYLIDELP